MTTEQDFHAALDTRPDDWQTRLVFADWLEERSDPRAAGYRALGTLRKRPFVCGHDNPPSEDYTGAAWFGCDLNPDEATFDLPEDWFGAIEGLGDGKSYRPSYPIPDAKSLDRRRVEDAAARAFGTLPADRRTAILALPPVRKRKRKARAPKT